MTSPSDKNSPSVRDLIERMCLTDDHSYGLMDPDERIGIERRMEQIYEHDIRPWIEAQRPPTAATGETPSLVESLRATCDVLDVAAADRIDQLERELAFRNRQYDDLWAEIQRNQAAPSAKGETLVGVVARTVNLGGQGLCILDAPCVFCGYKGAGYWQIGTHAKDCPFHEVGGDASRADHITHMSQRTETEAFHRLLQDEGEAYEGPSAPAEEAPQFEKIGALHRTARSGVQFLQDAEVIPLDVHETLDVFMRRDMNKHRADSASSEQEGPSPPQLG